MTIFLIILTVAIGISAIVFLPRLVANNYVNSRKEKRFEIENESRKTLIQILGGVAFFSTFYFSYQTYNLSYEQQITNRYTETIKLLSNENREVRIGALYGLERLFKDSKKDQISILQIINAYIRNRTISISDMVVINYLDLFFKKPEVDDYSCPFHNLPKNIAQYNRDSILYSLDIQVAINILGHSNNGLIRLDFSKLDLRGINFSNLNLSNSDFKNSILSHSDFRNSIIDSCDFDYAYCNSSTFSSSKIRKTTFSSAMLADANFYQADLSNSEINGCCKNCQFGEAILKEVKFENGVDLRRALFWDANLSNVSTEFVDMDSVVLDRTILKGADLRGVKNLSTIELKKAIIDDKTQILK